MVIARALGVWRRSAARSVVSSSSSSPAGFCVYTVAGLLPVSPCHPAT
jgi:hypothetical protein